MTHYFIAGASRGLGAAFAEGLPQPGDTVWLLSRGRPAGLENDDDVSRVWLPVDLLNPAAPGIVKGEVENAPIDVLLYNAGIWEPAAFSDGYDFSRTPADANDDVLTVNLTAPLHLIQQLLPNVCRSQNGKIILIGSTSGLDNSRAPEVAYNASKFGLRGLAHGLRELLRPDFVGVTVVNPGTINTETPLSEGIEGAAGYSREMIPMDDLVNLVRTVIQLSRYTCVKEINVPAMADQHV